MTNWAKTGKSAIVSARKQGGGKKNYGEARKAVLDSAEFSTFKSGSTGIVSTYSVDGLKYPVRNYTVLENSAGKKNPTALAIFKKHLLALGASVGDVEAFEKLDKEEATDLLSSLKGTEVCTFIGEEEYMGKTRPKITLVVPIDDSPLAD